MMCQNDLTRLIRRGWRLSQDGSTSTAQLAWDDPDDPESGWEILVLHTAGHGSRLTVNAFGSGLTERPPREALPFIEGLQEARALLEEWRGEAPP
jgi:hypothetical protein